MKRRQRVWNGFDIWVVVIGGLTVAFGIVLFLRMMSPIICEKAAAKLQSRFNIICNEAVLSYIEKENITYKEIVDIERGQDGQVRAMNTEMTEVNKMKAAITLEVQKRLDTIEEISVRFPTNGFFGIGGGIDIPVGLIATGVIETEINSSFEGVGINQTRLYITVTIEANGKLLLGGGEETAVGIKTTVPISQTVIVGDVPNTYVDIDKAER